MERKKRKFFQKQHGVFKRVFSLIMVFAMVITMTQFAPGGVTAKADDYTVKLYFELPDETSATDWCINVWAGAEVTEGDFEHKFRPSTWGGEDTTEYPALLNADGKAGWAYVTLKVTGSITGIQFVKTDGTEYPCWNKGITDNNLTEAYFVPKGEKTGTWYKEDSKTTEIVEEKGEDCTVKLHYYNRDWSSANAHLWNDKGDLTGGWPGKPATKEADKPGWFTYEITVDNSLGLGAIFNDGNGHQTGNLNIDIEGETGVEAWCRGLKVGDTSNNSAPVEYEAPDDWTNPGSEPETPETPETPDESDESAISVSDRVQLKIDDGTPVDMLVYMNGVYEVPVDLASGTHTAQVLVNGEAYGDSDTVQVTNAGTVYFRLQGGTLKNSVEDGIVHTAAFVGNFTGIQFVDEEGEGYTIVNWRPADDNAELTYVGGGIYTRTFLFEELAADVTLGDGGYKVAFDDDWDYSIGEGSSNIALTIPAGADSITLFVNEISGKVYDSIRTEEFDIVQNDGPIKGKPFVTTVSLIGEARGETDTWVAGATGYEFTQISDTLYRYQKTFNEGKYNYKCVFDYSKWYEKSDNIDLNVRGTKNVVFIYDTVDGRLYDSVNNESEVAVKLGMQAAPPKNEVIDNGDGSVTFNAAAADGVTVKLYYGDKADVTSSGTSALTAVDMIQAKNGAAYSCTLSFGDNAVDIVFYYDINGTRTLVESQETVTVGGADYSSFVKDGFAGKLVTVPGTFPGPSWNPEENVMEYKGNNRYEYTFENVPAANYEFKIAIGGSWAENYGKGGVFDGPNISVKVPEQQDVTIYYSDVTHLAVTSLDYIFADVDLIGTGIPDGTKLTDEGLTGIYSATVSMSAGTYSDIKLVCNRREYEFVEFTLDAAKDVTYYFDPVSGIYYNDAFTVDTSEIYYNSKDSAYKSIYGAVATGENVKFSIDTGADATLVRMVFKGVDPMVLSMEKDGAVENGVQKWSVETSFSEIGENNYYFVVYNGPAVSVYSDDDGYYGEGEVTSLVDVTPYDLVIYQEGYKTPDWMKNAVIYQIFPDRFFNGDTSNDFAQVSARGEVNYEYVKDWYMLPENPEQEAMEGVTEEIYKAQGAFWGDRQWSNEIYGGDFAGIVKKIDYLKALGVNVIYLNPSFASISSHRYDTSDYRIIDPILGDMGDFAELVKVAEENNMHIILDGVFNHVSDDSIYFDRYYKYLQAGTDTVGAYPYWAYVYDYMAENSVGQEAAETAARKYFTDNYGIKNYSYVEWFDVMQTTMDGVTDGIGLRAGKPVYNYEGWWGYDSMPVIKSTNGSEYQTGNWAEDIIYNANGTSVTQYWISKGTNGWRLDVANEVSDETWQNFRRSVKAMDSDAVIIGEIWDDATEYLVGDMYDSVMNYVFRNAVLGFAKGGEAQDAVKTLERIRERYPKEAFYAMMNLVDSHDTTRVLSFLDGINDDRDQKDLKSAFPTYEGTSEQAKKRQYLVAFLQFTYAGAPTVYYGDEIGMVGADDPDDRRGFTWGKGNKELVTWYAAMAAIRNSYPALRTGDLEVFNTGNANVMSYIRRDSNDTLIILANNAQTEQKVTLDLGELNVDAATLTDIVSGTEYSISGVSRDASGSVEVTIPAVSGAILTADPKEFSVDVDALAPAYDASYIIPESVLAESITVSKTTATVKVGENLQLSAVVAPANVTDSTVIWTSSNEAVATVDANGKVTAVAPGTAVIRAKAAFAANVIAECTVTVPSPVNGSGEQPTQQGWYDGWAGVSAEQKAKLMRESLAQNAAVTAPNTNDNAPIAMVIMLLMTGAVAVAGAVGKKRKLG